MSLCAKGETAKGGVSSYPSFSLYTGMAEEKRGSEQRREEGGEEKR